MLIFLLGLYSFFVVHHRIEFGILMGVYFICMCYTLKLTNDIFDCGGICNNLKLYVNVEMYTSLFPLKILLNFFGIKSNFIYIYDYYIPRNLQGILTPIGFSTITICDVSPIHHLYKFWMKYLLCTHNIETNRYSLIREYLPINKVEKLILYFNQKKSKIIIPSMHPPIIEIILEMGCLSFSVTGKSSSPIEKLTIFSCRQKSITIQDLNINDFLVFDSNKRKSNGLNFKNCKIKNFRIRGFGSSPPIAIPSSCESIGLWCDSISDVEKKLDYSHLENKDFVIHDAFRLNDPIEENVIELLSEKIIFSPTTKSVKINYNGDGIKSRDIFKDILLRQLHYCFEKEASLLINVSSFFEYKNETVWKIFRHILFENTLLLYRKYLSIQ